MNNQPLNNDEDKFFNVESTDRIVVSRIMEELLVGRFIVRLRLPTGRFTSSTISRRA